MRRLFLLISILSVALVTSLLSTSSADPDVPMHVEYYQLSKEAKKQANCLAENIYFEAGLEPNEGKLAVAMVTLNRVASGNFPSTICEVVHQKTGNVCQFSWYCDKSFLARRSKAIQSDLYKDIRKIAVFAMMNYETIEDKTNGAMYYHANYIKVPWKLNVTARIGQHVFYKRSKEPNWKKEYKV